MKRKAILFCLAFALTACFFPKARAAKYGSGVPVDAGFPRSPLSATIYLDQSAEQELEKRRIPLKAITTEVYKVFRTDNLLEFSYRFGEGSVIRWLHSDEYNASRPKKKGVPITTESYVLLEREVDWLWHNRCEASVCIFLSGDLDRTRGQAFRDKEAGKGAILLGAGVFDEFWETAPREELNEEYGYFFLYGTDDEEKAIFKETFSKKERRCLKKAAKLPYTEMLALYWVHEQAHLYYLGHSLDPCSIMYPVSNASRKFDGTSLNEIRRHLKIIRKN